MSDDARQPQKRPWVLVLDDEDAIRDMLERVLRRAGYECVTAGDLASARLALGERQFDLVLCDIALGGESGLDLVRELNRDLADVAIVMVTGDDNPAVASVAITLGAYGYLVKPFTQNEVLIHVDGALRRRELERVRRFHVDELEAKVLERTPTLHEAFDRLDEAPEAEVVQREMADRLTAALTLRDEETGRHIERVGRYAALLSVRAGISDWLDDELLVAAMLHDVGKIAVPDLVLLKPGALSETEQATMRRHPEAGFRLLDGGASRILRLGASVALTHHERWDGGGYPRGLAGAEIPVEGRITAIADAFDAITHPRVYQPARTVDEAVGVMRAQRGRQFDPDLLDVFLSVVDEVVAIGDELRETEPGDSPVRVLVVDDHTLFSETTVRMLDRVPGIAVAGAATTVSAAVERCESAGPPDVVLTEWLLPDGTGADVALRVHEVAATAAVVVLTETWDDRVLLDALDAGCVGCIGKRLTFDDLVASVRAAAAGEALMPPGRLLALLRRLAPRSDARAAAVTAREREVLQLMAHGLSTEAIAGRLDISPHTVRSHAQHVIEKLGAHSRLEAVANGVRAGLVER